MSGATYHRAPGVAWVDADDVNSDDPVVYVARVPLGRPLVLADSAWAIWSALGEEGGTLDEVAARVAELAELEETTVRDQVAVFLDDLVQQVLVVRDPPTGAPGISR